MIYLNIITVLTLTAYLIWVRLTLGYWSSSISIGFIDVKEKTGKINWPFWVMIAVSSIALCINGLYYWNLEWNFHSIPYLFLGGLGVSGVNWFCLITKKPVKIMHLINAAIGFGVSLLAFWANYDLWYIPLIAAIIAIIVYKTANDKSKILWSEIVLSYSIFIGLIILNIKY